MSLLELGIVLQLGYNTSCLACKVLNTTWHHEGTGVSRFSLTEIHLKPVNDNWFKVKGEEDDDHMQRNLKIIG